MKREKQVLIRIMIVYYSEFDVFINHKTIWTIQTLHYCLWRLKECRAPHIKLSRCHFLSSVSRNYIEPSRVQKHVDIRCAFVRCSANDYQMGRIMMEANASRFNKTIVGIRNGIWWKASAIYSRRPNFVFVNSLHPLARLLNIIRTKSGA